MNKLQISFSTFASSQLMEGALLTMARGRSYWDRTQKREQRNGKDSLVETQGGTNRRDEESWYN